MLNKLGCGVLLCTCGRTELYFCCGRESAESVLAAAAGVRAPWEYFRGAAAERHLFSLACGLESMIQGEDEILGQLKKAYLLSLDLGVADGQINCAFQAAIACGKAVRAQTGISTTPLSAATLAANLVFDFIKQERASVLLVGATGTIGSSILKNIAKRREIELTVTARRHGVEGLRQDFCGGKIIAYEARYNVLDQSDVVISCTASPHMVFTAEGVRGALKSAKRRLFLDLAVPPDVEEGVGDLPDTLRYGIDDFAASAQKNAQIKAEELRRVRALCEERFALYERQSFVRVRRSALSELSEDDRRAVFAAVKTGSIDYLKDIFKEKP